MTTTSSPPDAITGPDYVELPFTTDEQTLADSAIAALQAAWPDYEPNDADMEVVLIETLAPMAANAASIASNMPPGALIAFGTKLLGLPYDDGTQAQTTVTLTFQDDQGGYVVLAGAEFDLGDYAFSLVQDVSSVAGSAQLTGVPVVCNTAGAAANGLTSQGAGWASVTLPVWVTDLATEAPAAGGVDPQDDNDYLNEVARELQLRGRMVVTLVDYEIVAIDTPGVGRAHAETVGPRDVVVTLTDPQGEPVPQAIKDALAAVYDSKRLVNMTVALADAAYSTIDVAYTVMALSGVNPLDLAAMIDARLTGELSPAGWGAPTSGDPGTVSSLSWTADNTIRVNKLISVIGSVVGVAYVDSVLVNGAAVDYVMPGAVALPRPGAFTGTINSPPFGSP